MSASKGNGKPNYEDYLLASGLEEITLPSGMPVKLQPPGMEYFLKLGVLPGRLALGSSPEQTKESLGGLQGDPEWAYREMCILLCSVFVEPRFSEHPQPGDGTLDVKRLKPNDAILVLNWADQHLRSITRGGSADLETFRGGDGEPAAAGESGEVLGGASEPIPGAAGTAAN